MIFLSIFFPGPFPAHPLLPSHSTIKHHPSTSHTHSLCHSLHCVTPVNLSSSLFRETNGTMRNPLMKVKGKTIRQMISVMWISLKSFHGPVQAQPSQELNRLLCRLEAEIVPNDHKNSWALSTACTPSWKHNILEFQHAFELYKATTEAGWNSINTN